MKKEKTQDYWKLIFIIVPAILYGNIAKLINDKNLAYTFGFTVLGVCLGFLLHYLTKNKIIIIKLISIVILVLIPFAFMISSNQKEDLLKKEWSSHKFDRIEFSSPNKLKLISSKVPNKLNEYYKKYEVYSDGANNRRTSIYSIGLKDDNIDIDNYLKQYLDRIKTNIPSLSSVEIIEQKNNKIDIYTKYKFIINNNDFTGFCRLMKNNNEINMFWLIPISEGFSNEYIKRFNESIK